jgi:hypothetical protein
LELAGKVANLQLYKRKIREGEGEEGHEAY